jgi:hypothetical protein
LIFWKFAKILSTFCKRGSHLTKITGTLQEDVRPRMERNSFSIYRGNVSNKGFRQVTRYSVYVFHGLRFSK